VVAAGGLLGQLVGAHGAPLAVHDGLARTGPTRVFPTPARLAAAELTTLGIPKARAAAVSALAAAVAADPELLSCDRDPEATMVRLRRFPRIGESTAPHVPFAA